MKIAVAVSGGMDSLLSLALLKERGVEVLAVHGFFLPEKNEATAGKLAERCAGMGIEFHALDLRDEFERLVAGEFIASYLAGRTPNPCAACNRAMKFGVLFEQAKSLGATHLATGHYARLLDHPETGRLLVRGADPAKDQSYFLSLVPGAALERTVFPLGDMRKADVPAELERRGLEPPLPSESQEICFVPDDDYQAYLEHAGAGFTGGLLGEGPMTLVDGREVGRHGGLWRYTQGQRRGLGIAWSEPLYVIDKDLAANRLIVGPRTELFCAGCVASAVNCLVAPQHWPAEVYVQTRYRQQAAPASATLESGKLVITFCEPQSRPAPGQVATVYGRAGAGMGDMVLAGGVVDAVSSLEDLEAGA